MRTIILVVLVGLSMHAFSQTSFPVKGELVKVKDWDSRSIIQFENFFDATQGSIIAQVGKEEFDNLKSRCTNAGWPVGIYRPDLTNEEDEAFDSLLNKLRMYKIAAYTHIYNGKTFDRYVILRVPYDENKNWDTNVKWEGNIYFLLKEDDVINR